MFEVKKYSIEMVFVLILISVANAAGLPSELSVDNRQVLGYELLYSGNNVLLIFADGSKTKVRVEKVVGDVLYCTKRHDFDLEKSYLLSEIAEVKDVNDNKNTIVAIAVIVGLPIVYRLVKSLAAVLDVFAIWG